MLLAALSRSSLPGAFGSFSHQQFSVAPGWLLTIATDELLSGIKVSDDEIVGAESLLSPLGVGSDVKFISARFSRQLRTLEILKTTISGRPVYYHLGSNGEFFVSTHIRLLRQAGVVIEENVEVVPELLIYRTVAPPRTLYRAIQQLPAAGQILVQIKEQGCSLTVNSGYSLPEGMGKDHDEGDISTRVTEFLSDAVGRLKPAGQSVATLLSGGVDSSILCGLAVQQLDSYDTYSSSYPFEDPEKDFEKAYALSAAAALATRHNFFVPNSLDFLKGVVEGLGNAETPLDHLQSVLLHLLFKYAIPKHLNHVIHGAVAEVAWGTETHLALGRAGTSRQNLLSTGPALAMLRMAGAFWPKALAIREGVETVQRLGLPLSSPQNPLWKIGAYGDREWVQARYRVSAEDVIRSRYDNLRSFADRPMEDVIALYSFNFQVAANIALWSKLAEGQGKIIYYPFADRDLLDFGFSIPWNLKLKSAKRFLRESGRALGIPGAILDRPKRSFGINSDRWAEKGGVLEPLIPVAAKVVDIDELRSLQGRASRPAMTLWSLLNYAILKRLFILNESLDDLLSEVADNYQRIARQRR